MTRIVTEPDEDAYYRSPRRLASQEEAVWILTKILVWIAAPIASAALVVWLVMRALGWLLGGFT